MHRPRCSMKLPKIRRSTDPSLRSRSILMCAMAPLSWSSASPAGFLFWRRPGPCPTRASQARAPLHLAAVGHGHGVRHVPAHPAIEHDVDLVADRPAQRTDELAVANHSLGSVGWAVAEEPLGPLVPLADEFARAFGRAAGLD